MRNIYKWSIIVTTILMFYYSSLLAMAKERAESNEVYVDSNTIQTCIDESNEVVLAMTSNVGEILVPEDKTITINTNGYNIASIHNYGDLSVFDACGTTTLSIQHNGTTTEDRYDESLIINEEGATLLLKGISLVNNTKLKYTDYAVFRFSVYEYGIQNYGKLIIDNCSIDISCDIYASRLPRLDVYAIYNQGTLESRNNKYSVYGTVECNDTTYGGSCSLYGIYNIGDAVLMSGDEVNITYVYDKTVSIHTDDNAAILNDSVATIDVSSCKIQANMRGGVKSCYPQINGIVNSGMGIINLNGSTIDVQSTGSAYNNSKAVGINNTSGSVYVGTNELTEIKVFSDYGHSIGIYLFGSDTELTTASINEAIIISSSSNGMANGLSEGRGELQEIILGEDDGKTTYYPCIYGTSCAISSDVNGNNDKVYDGMFWGRCDVAGEMTRGIKSSKYIRWKEDSNCHCIVTDVTMPLIQSCEDTNDGIIISLRELEAEKTYDIYRVEEGKSYATKLANISTNIYKDVTAKEETTYTYYVLMADGSLTYSDSVKKESQIEKVIWGQEGYSFEFAYDGEVKCYHADGTPVINEFKCDGTYTYYFQSDGTAMRDRLTYHPDGVHVIYFDENGHEVFSNFANVKKTIAGVDVDDYCFFDVYGYLYVDVVTYDQTGTYLYYANPYGVMDRGRWFEFSDSCKWADGTPFDKAGGRYGYANADGTLMINQWTTDWEGRPCYMQGNGVALY